MPAAVWMTALMASLSVLDYNPLSLLLDSMSPCYVNFPIFSIADWSGIASRDLSSNKKKTKLLILKITACHPPGFSFLLKWIFIPFCMFQREINTMLGVLSITPKKSRIEISICKWRKALRIFFFFSFHSLYLLQLSLCRSWVHKINPVSAQRLGSLDNRKPLALIISQLFAFCATVEIKCSPRSRLSAASTEVSAWASGLIYTTICGGIISVISQTYVFQSSHICWCGSRTYW